VKDNANCIAHVWRFDFSLENLYAIKFDLDGYIPEGKNLVARFYTWYNVYQGKTTEWSENIPGYIALIDKKVTHPQGKPVEKVGLIVEDENGDFVRTVTTFIVTKRHLASRYSDILSAYPLASPSEKTILSTEYSDLLGQYVLAPS
jgi:hypothetical protein